MILDMTTEVREASKVTDALFKPSKSGSLSELLESNSLSAENLIESLADIAHNGTSDALRLRALETGLKLHPATRQAMKEHDERVIPIVNIIIHDGGVGPNPILIPRRTINEAA